MLLRASIFLVGTVLFGANEKNFTYLALGDSVAYGLDVTLLSLDPTRPLPNPSAFTGYPEVIARREHLLTSKKEVNTSCPGETSRSFIHGNTPDNGCYGPGPDGEPPFKTWIGLHTNYFGSQLGFAIANLSTNKHINLVTLGIGGNDILLLLHACSADPNFQVCVGTHLQGIVDAYAANLAEILTGIRKTAGYDGDLVLVLYYSPVPELIPIVQAFNAATFAVGLRFGARFADGFTAFQLAAAAFGGDVCKAGLLVRLDANTCDVHPSPKGHELLADTILAALGGKH